MCYVARTQGESGAKGMRGTVAIDGYTQATYGPFTPPVMEVRMGKLVEKIRQ